MPAKKKQRRVTAAAELVPAGSGEGGDDGVPVADGTQGDDESVGTTSSYSWTEAQKETIVEFLQEHDVFITKAIRSLRIFAKRSYFGRKVCETLVQHSRD